MRAWWGLEQLEICPQTPLHSSPWWAALGWDLPVLHMATWPACGLLFSCCKFSSSSPEWASSNCLPDSFLPGEDDWKSELTFYLSGLWLSSCDSHVTACVSIGFGPFSNFSPRYCKDTLSVTLFWKFTYFCVFISFPLPAECLHWMLFLHLKHTAWAPSYLYMRERIPLILFNLSSFTLLSRTKSTSLQTPNCSRERLLLLLSVFSRRHPIYLFKLLVLSEDSRPSDTPAFTSWRKESILETNQARLPTWAPRLLAGCVKYISE